MTPLDYIASTRAGIKFEGVEDARVRDLLWLGIQWGVFYNLMVLAGVFSIWCVVGG